MFFKGKGGISVYFKKKVEKMSIANVKVEKSVFF